MEFGLGELKLSPDHFWSMTVSELMAAQDWMLRTRGGKYSLGSDDIDDLQEFLSRQPEKTYSIAAPRGGPVTYSSIRN